MRADDGNHRTKCDHPSLSVPLSGCLGIDVAAEFAEESAPEDARLVRRTVNEHLDLPGAPEFGLEAVPLRRYPLQFDKLPSLDRVPELQASVGLDRGLDDQVAHLELRVARPDLNLHRA